MPDWRGWASYASVEGPRHNPIAEAFLHSSRLTLQTGDCIQFQFARAELNRLVRHILIFQKLPPDDPERFVHRVGPGIDRPVLIEFRRLRMRFSLQLQSPLR